MSGDRRDISEIDMADRADQLFCIFVACFAIESLDDDERFNSIESCKRSYDALRQETQSPIENIMAAMLSCVSNGYTHGCVAASLGGKDGPVAFVYPQFQMQINGRKYRADFMVSCNAGGGKPECVIFECDGHAYHEKTKEQAARDKARDRAMTAEGYTVYRFTGSELYSNPHKSFNEVQAALEAAMDASVQRFIAYA